MNWEDVHTLIEYIEGSILYENPRPHVRSRHGYFPGLVRLHSGELLALFVMGEAFESADCTTVVARSADRGRTWKIQGPLHDKSNVALPYSDSMKATVLPDGSLIATGYCFYRHDPEEPIANPNTGGILPGDMLLSFSRDDGRSWSLPEVIPRSRPELPELSGPCLALRSGDLLCSTAPFKLPDGTNPSGPQGLLLRSRDGGRTWSDHEIYFRSRFTPLESRLCEMPDGRVVALVWAYSYPESISYPNHFAISHDNGHHWSDPIDTGVRGQASSLTWLRDDLLLTVHAHREDDPGVVVRIVDLAHDQWRVVQERLIWNGEYIGYTRDGHPMTRMFRNLRFGQPSLLALGDEEFLVAHWSVEEGQGKIRLHRIRVGV